MPFRRLIPGVALCAALAVAAWPIQLAEERLVGHALIEALVVAILLGTAVRTFGTIRPSLLPGINFTAKPVLETAIVLLGASVDLPALLRAGPALGAGIVLVVVLGLAAGFTIARAVGLEPKLATLVACGNAICGNSAIAAVAPVIGAEPEQIASAIAFTAALGVAVVLALPSLMRVLHFNNYQYGVLAGLTVYAVPQVIAASFPVSALSGQVGTLVKLVRVLMLGPVVLFFALRHHSLGRGGRRLRFGTLVPWFIVGFIVLAVLRSLGALPTTIADPLRELSRWLTVAAMAALGLGVDLREMRRVGRPVALAVSGSLVVLIAMSVALIRTLGIR